MKVKIHSRTKILLALALGLAWSTSRPLSAKAEAMVAELFVQRVNMGMGISKRPSATVDLDSRTKHNDNAANEATASNILNLLEQARLLRDSGKPEEALKSLDMAAEIADQLKEVEDIKGFVEMPIYMSRFNTLTLLGRHKEAALSIDKVLGFIERKSISDIIKEDSSFLGTAPYSAYLKAASASIHNDTSRAPKFLSKGIELLNSSSYRNEAASEKIYLEYARLFSRLGKRQQAIEIYSMLGDRYINSKEPSESPQYAGILYDLADLYMIEGNLGLAELLVQGSLRIYDKFQDTHKYEYQWSRLTLLRLQNKLDDALTVAEDIEWIATIEDNRGQALRALSTQLVFAERLQNTGKLTLLFKRIGNLPKTYFSYDISSSHAEDLLIIFNALSERYLSAGLINEARATLDPAVGIALRELGTGNFLTVKTLLILAKTDEYLDGKRARNLYRKLSEISHENGLLIQAIDSLSRLSFLEAKYGNTEKAIFDSKAHSRAYLEFLIDTLPSLTREDKVNTIGSYNSDVLHNLSASHQTAVEAGLWSAINERGLLNHIELGQRRLAEGRKQKALVNRLNDLTAISSTGFASDSHDNSTHARSAQLLLNQLTQYKPSRRFIEVNDFFDSLPADSTYIHIVRYKKIDFTVDSESMDYYGAYVGSSRGMYFVDIGKGGEIDSTIALARSSVSSNLSDSKYRLYRLHEQAVSPLLRNIKRGSTIYISLDSEMNTMPIGSLYSSINDEQTLSDDYTIRLVSSPRDFIIDSTGRPPVKGARSVVFADPVYTDSSNNHAHSSFRSRAEFSSHNTIRSWEPLKYAGAEGALISSKIKSSLYARDRASEKNLRAIKSPIILHIAAHAFFDPPNMANAVSSGDGKSELNVYQKIEHYLSGSGIALSSPTSSGDQLYGDGIITAAEASWLELSGTELVVLSACSTGDGVSTSGLGVFGLYRSFIEAGAKSVLMSLWRVDDESTKEFMNRFYDLIKDGMSRNEAVSTTQKEFREGKVGNGKWKDPFYWAAWQLVGDWGPIKGL